MFKITTGKIFNLVFCCFVLFFHIYHFQLRLLHPLQLLQLSLTEVGNNSSPKGITQHIDSCAESEINDICIVSNYPVLPVQ